MNPLAPFLCGLWDGVNLWIQWTPDPSAALYGLRTRYAPAPANGAEIQWGGWITHSAEPKPWRIIKAWKEGWYAQAQVRAYADESAAVRMDPEANWQDAIEARFAKSVCDFEISSQNRDLYYPSDSSGISATFVSIVDGGVCSYQMQGELLVQRGESKKVTLEAHLESGWSQLDYENHFLLKPSLGVVIRNLGPSENDLEPTGRVFTQMIKSAPRSLTVAFGKSRFNGG